MLALNFAVAAAGAMVIVNTVVIVQALLGRPQHDVALALGPFGAGSMAAALVLPRVLDRLSDRGVMLPSAAFLGVVLVGVAALTWYGAIGWPVLLGTWLVLRIGYSAAQFALSHASWLLTYPLAGCLGAAVGMPATLAALGALTVAGVAAAAMLWPASDPDVLAHAHADLDSSHPHVRGIGQGRHEHAFVIDDLHRQWPSRAN